jgi:hypothetical protein
MDSDDKVLRYVRYLPQDLVRYTRPYLPISLVKKVRKIRKTELPLNYRICKDLNDYFYMKYIGCDVDIKYLQFSIDVLKNKLLQNKRIVHPFSLDCLLYPFASDSYIRREIAKKEDNIANLNTMMNYYYPMYCQSTSHLNNFKIIELE